MTPKHEFLLLLDLDGTIISPGQNIDPELLDQLRYFNDSASLLITTARHPKGVEFVFDDLIGFIPTISLNGGGLHLNSWNKYDCLVYLSWEVVEKLEAACERWSRVTVNYYTEESWYTDQKNAMVIEESRFTGIKPRLFNGTLDGHCIKILLMGNADDIINIKATVMPGFSEEIVCHRSHPNYLEITSSMTSKAFFVNDYLMRFRKIARSQVSIFFVGDSENDIECAKYADCSWTYRSSPDELKKYCSILEAENGKGLKTLLTKIRR